jgi:hypothetical protein
MAINQRDADFFRPLWRRVVVTAVVAAWFCYETFFSKDQLWITITAVGLAYCVWNLFLHFPKDPPGSTGGGTPAAAPSGTPDTDTDTDGTPKA